MSVTSSKRGNVTFKKLTDAELAKKRELGCFRCNEKYSPTHQCKNKQLQLMILQPAKEEGGEWNGDDDEEVELPETKVHMELSMCSVVSLLGNDTMKVTGKIKGEEVVILIDSRASHNFISSET